MKKGFQVDEAKILAYSSTLFYEQLGLPMRSSWNGRQIRNAFQTAVAIAEAEAFSEKKQPEIKVEHFKLVAKVSAEFDNYLFQTRGMTDNAMAAQEATRDDSRSKIGSSQHPHYPPPGSSNPIRQPDSRSPYWSRSHTASPSPVINYGHPMTHQQLGNRAINAPYHPPIGQTMSTPTYQVPLRQSMQQGQMFFNASPSFQSPLAETSNVTPATVQPSQQQTQGHVYDAQIPGQVQAARAEQMHPQQP